ncbi:riboflavin transporter FmnP [Anoxybacillus sp. UARK-01]|uniref:ECF transporter S component n=1 Tax=Anoxybacillaceae TaxID=3120669 RepID=UPI0009BBC5FC|nr:MULTISPECIES: ECF transporter S component [Anoxybacillus]MBB3905778.1 riboflavin transporter FmnP [Anoxybacillus rupiensis]OQM45869.1 riboflavin transporter FmnP [Anoxybacillus sp. UARK-01]
MKNMNVSAFAAIGLFSAIAYLLMLLNFPLPSFPPFLLVDFSDVPALVAALMYGPIAGMLVELFKNVLNYFLVGSATGVPVGHFANFMAGITFILPTYYIYRKAASKQGMVIGLVAGTIVMATAMSVLNYYIFLPAYTIFLGSPAMSAPEAKALIVSAIFPFNALKGVFITVVFMLLFLRLRPWLHKRAASRI